MSKALPFRALGTALCLAALSCGCRAAPVELAQVPSPSAPLAPAVLPSAAPPAALSAPESAALLAPESAASSEPEPVSVAPASSEPSPEPAPSLPPGFVYLRDADPDIEVDLRYAAPDNFTGAPVDGYESGQAAILATEAAEALALVQADLRALGLGLKVFDAYRPQRAVDAFVLWAQTPDDDTSAKAAYYPHEDKASLFARGYLAHRSAHSRGSTVDLTLIRLDGGGALDMGTPYDFLDPLSAHGAPGLTAEQEENRLLLKNAMAARGLVAYSREWWHYTYKPEPFPDTYFDFTVR